MDIHGECENIDVHLSPVWVKRDDNVHADFC